MVCDFCNLPDPPHSYAADSHIVTSNDPYVAGSAGAWTACDACNALIASGQRGALLTRSASTLIIDKNLPLSILPAVREAIAHVHEGFWNHRTSDAQPTDANAPPVEEFPAAVCPALVPSATFAAIAEEILRATPTLTVEELFRDTMLAAGDTFLRSRGMCIANGQPARVDYHDETATLRCTLEDGTPIALTLLSHNLHAPVEDIFSLSTEAA